MAKINAKNLVSTIGGTYNMVEGNDVEKRVCKLHLLQEEIQLIVDRLCDCGELRKNIIDGPIMAFAELLYDQKWRDRIENYSLYKVEFPDYEGDRAITVPGFLFEGGWEDISWHNDACPSFVNAVRGLKLWVDRDNPRYRELPSAKFVLTEEYNDQIYVLAAVETEEELLAALKKHAKG